MKYHRIYSIWLAIILINFTFLGVLGSLSGQSSVSSSINDNFNYRNGYLNFAFNGLTRILNGESLNSNSLGLETISAEKRVYNVKSNYTALDKSVEKGFNKNMKRIFGFDLDGMIRKIENLPLGMP